MGWRDFNYNIFEIGIEIQREHKIYELNCGMKTN